MIEPVKRKWVIRWKYCWSYSMNTNKFTIFKHYYRFNGKKSKPLSSLQPKPNEIVFTSTPPFIVKTFERIIEVEHYDYGEWCVSERSSTSQKTILDYDRKLLEDYFNKIISQLPNK